MEQGQPYKACKPGQEPSSNGEVCEPGAVAADPEQGDLTSRILALPSSMDAMECLEVDCAAYRVSLNGLQGAGVHTNREIGTSFVVQFLVVDEAGAWAAANRTVMIVAPCPDGEVLCPDKTCSVVECSLRCDLPSVNAFPVWLLDGLG